MNSDLLRKHIKIYQDRTRQNEEEYLQDRLEREERVKYYQGWTEARLLKMSLDDLYEYIAKLWAMLIWGNKKYVVDKIIEEFGLDVVRKELAHLVWGSNSIIKRWDRFRNNIKGIGPAMMSEILSHVHPDKYMIWNRRALVALDYLGFRDLPKYNYQLTGKKYSELCEAAKQIITELENEGFENPNLLTVDYFFWDELQVEDNLSQILSKSSAEDDLDTVKEETAEFIHDEIRDKIAEIGVWLGFSASIEKKVAEGSKVDTIWEATIGNMGRVIYVFEVQTKGSIDSLILNLLKSMNNPAVQGVVAVSDSKQLDTIRRHAKNVGNLAQKLKYWDYQEVLRNHEALSVVNESINRLGLVPQSFDVK